MATGYQRDILGPGVIFPINQRASHLEMYLLLAGMLYRQHLKHHIGQTNKSSCNEGQVSSCKIC
jgi:hypothetical protein